MEGYRARLVGAGGGLAGGKRGKDPTTHNKVGSPKNESLRLAPKKQVTTCLEDGGQNRPQGGGGGRGGGGGG